MASKQWKDYKKTLGKQLTDNVKANESLAPFYFVLIAFLFGYHHKMNFWVGLNLQSGAVLAFISTAVYIFVSNYYQPDLDIHRNRPGMGHFPFGRWVGAYKYGRFLKFMAFPINRIWYYFWHPYGQIMTHRGLGHWPIIGVWIRSLYIYVAFSSFYLFFDYFGFHFEIIKNVIDWSLSFFPFHKDFASKYWFLFCFPVYMSDLIHFLVDYYDSSRKGISFCPPAIPRGLIGQVLDSFKKNKK